MIKWHAEPSLKGPLIFYPATHFLLIIKIISHCCLITKEKKYLNKRPQRTLFYKSKYILSKTMLGISLLT